MAYVNEKNLRKEENTRKDKELILKEIENAFKKYKKDKNYEYDFDDEPREGGKDCETSYLSAFIFLELIKEYLSNINKKNINVKQTYENYFLTNVGGTAGSRKIYYDGGEAIMGFDVMNNPNKPTGPEPPHILYDKFKDTDEINELRKIYHTTGNFTFFPRSKNYDRKIEFQTAIHNTKCKENWNCALKYLKENWTNYQFDGFCKFEEYIEVSLQQFYTIDGWDYLKKKIKCDEKYSDKLIKNHNELKTFYNDIKGFSGEIYDKDYDEDDIKVIIAIIKIRSHLIIMKLNGKI